MQSQANSPQAYLESLPEERKVAISAIREVILKNLPVGFEEVMGYGMLGYVVPHAIYPAGYHCNPKLPLPFINVASQKNHISIYHLALYEGTLLDWFKAEWEKNSSKKLDIGKGCVRFKKFEDVPLHLIGEMCSKISVEDWIALYEKALKR